MSTFTVHESAPATPEAAWDELRLLLESQRAHCVRQRELAVAEAIAAMPDQVALSRAASLFQRIKEIDAALRRIAIGTYGLCVYCGHSIPQGRLQVLPFAAGCVSCQESAR